MPVIVVDDDKVLRFLHVLLDPEVPPDRAAALTDFLSFDIADVDTWIDNVRGSSGPLYPASVRMVPDQDALHAALPEADAVVVEGLAVPAFKASGDITSMSQADGYIEIPAQTDLVEKGETVEVKLF